MIRLSPRLYAVLQRVKGKTVADIGTDHGLLIIESILSGRAEKGYAVDISADSLHKAVRNAEKYGVENDIEFLLGDGLEPLKGKDAECIVIAGMGGINIRDILSKNPTKALLILVPHQDASVLRDFLAAEGYAYYEDFVVEDGKLYQIMTVQKGESNFSSDRKYFGANYPESESYYKMLNKRKEEIETIANGNFGGDREKLPSRLKDELTEIEKWQR